MRKLFIVGFCLTIISNQLLQAQFCSPDSAKAAFSGIAPAPWGIDGQINDWNTLLGPFTGSNLNPYNPPRRSAFNWSTERPGFNLGDRDQPNPAHDLSFQAFTNDDYNIYFYFRKTNVSKSPGSFMYFIDLNHDGYMALGEPVIGAQYNGQHVGVLTMYKFIPDTTSNYVPGKGNRIASNDAAMDGFTVSGTVEKVFTANKIPTNMQLESGEVFDAAITESGYGMELAVPWSFLRNYETGGSPLLTSSVFIYHLTLQKGGGPGYNTEDVEDNIGNCCQFITASSPAAYEISSDSRVLSSTSTEYRIHVVIQNLTNAIEAYNAVSVELKNMVLKAGASLTPEEVSVSVYVDGNVNGIVDPGEYGLIFENFANTFSFHTPQLLPLTAAAGPLGKGAFIIVLTLPANKVTSLRLEFAPSIRFSASILAAIYCTENTGGGKPINPIGFTLEENVESKTRRTTNAEKENLIETPIVFPNPSKNEATIRLPVNTGPADIQLMNALGATVQTWKKVSTASLQIRNLKAGSYFIKVMYPGSGKQYLLRLLAL